MSLTGKKMNEGDTMSEIAPHTCCLCGSPAYVGFNEVQCTNAECRHYHLETAELFAGETSIPKPKGQTDPLEGRGWGTPAVILTYSYEKGYEEAVTDMTTQLDSYIQDLERLKDE